MTDPRPRASAHGDATCCMIVRGINHVNEGATPEDMLSIRAWIEPHRVLTMRHRQLALARS